MVRLLFTVNEHATEPFAISVARETARLFQREGYKILVVGKDKIPEKPKGNEILWMKIKADETTLGTVLKEEPTEKISGNQLMHIDHETALKIIRFTHETKSDFNYRFHCAKPGYKIWKWWPPADFDISHDNPNRKFQVIEIRALLKNMPKRILEKVQSRTQDSFMVEKYLTETTSHQKSRRYGLTPKEFAKAIKAKIKIQIRAKEQGKMVPDLRRKIKRVRKTQKKPKSRRSLMQAKRKTRRK